MYIVYKNLLKNVTSLSVSVTFAIPLKMVNPNDLNMNAKIMK